MRGSLRRVQACPAPRGPDRPELDRRERLLARPELDRRERLLARPHPPGLGHPVRRRLRVRARLARPLRRRRRGPVVRRRRPVPVVRRRRPQRPP
ncbi:MAG: hypothetical protein QOG01_3996, partial [Pseudonocardiales bacterium]|nr:hypothetical protein [Pseudonocardiales bacterium]